MIRKLHSLFLLQVGIKKAVDLSRDHSQYLKHAIKGDLNVADSSQCLVCCHLDHFRLFSLGFYFLKIMEYSPELTVSIGCEGVIASLLALRLQLIQALSHALKLAMCAIGIYHQLEYYLTHQWLLSWP